MTFTDHPLRYSLANELHARPFPTVGSPSVAAYLAIKRGQDAASRNRSLDRAHFLALLDRYGAVHPAPEATHFYGQIGGVWIKWESHTEFVTYTVFQAGQNGWAFDRRGFDVFPESWLADAPGVRLTSALIRIEPESGPQTVSERLGDWFVSESLAVSRVLEGTATVAGDYRIDETGHMRFAVFTGADIGARRIGRIVQRLCEIETYKAMSMLGLAKARAISGRMAQIDGDLLRLVHRMTAREGAAGETLSELLELSSELENMSAKAAFRFAATGAYEAIVSQRIEVLREARFEGRQTFGEFMMRRFDPAMRTVTSTERRLAAMSERAIRVGGLLRTQVDVERQTQSQALLVSMDHRADLQLRLQRTVEGLSIVAVSYYAVGLVLYLAYPAAAVLGVSKAWLAAGATPVVMLCVWAMLRRIHTKAH